MGFLHVLGTIGKDVANVAGKAGGFIPGPIGLVVSTIGAVVTQETTNKPGDQKKVDAITSVSLSAPEHPNKIALIAKMIQAVVDFVNALSEFYSPEPVPPSNIPKT